MLINTYSNNKILRFNTDFFMNNIVKHNFMDYFDIYISDNIIEDYKALCPYAHTDGLVDIAGINILPHKSNGKITILISQENNTLDVVCHELGHMVDLVMFAQTFCHNDLALIRSNTYYKTFIYWSEFHVKQIDIPYAQILLNMTFIDTLEEAIQRYKYDIRNYLYDKYAEILLNKNNVDFRDIMWYLGEIIVCNLYDTENEYEIHKTVISKYGHSIVETFDILKMCLNFEQLTENIEAFHRFVLNQVF